MSPLRVNCSSGTNSVRERGSSMRIGRLVSKSIGARHREDAGTTHAAGYAPRSPTGPDPRSWRRQSPEACAGPSIACPALRVAVQPHYDCPAQSLGRRNAPASRRVFQSARHADIERVRGLDRHGGHVSVMWLYTAPPASAPVVRCSDCPSPARYSLRIASSNTPGKVASPMA